MAAVRGDALQSGGDAPLDVVIVDFARVADIDSSAFTVLDDAAVSVLDRVDATSVALQADDLDAAAGPDSHVET